MSKAELACLLVALIIVVSRFASGRVARLPFTSPEFLTARTLEAARYQPEHEGCEGS
jgi:hypothetical protein